MAKIPIDYVQPPLSAIVEVRQAFSKLNQILKDLEASNIGGGQQAHIADADGTLASVNSRVNLILTALETYGILASS